MHNLIINGAHTKFCLLGFFSSDSTEDCFCGGRLNFLVSLQEKLTATELEQTDLGLVKYLLSCIYKEMIKITGIG